MINRISGNVMRKLVKCKSETIGVQMANCIMATDDLKYFGLRSNLNSLNTLQMIVSFHVIEHTLMTIDDVRCFLKLLYNYL